MSLSRKTQLKRSGPIRRTEFKKKSSTALQRQRIKPKRKPISFHHGTAAGRKHMANVKQSGCVIPGCGQYAEAHHPLSMRRGRRASDYDTIALCFNHHKADSPLPHGEAIHKGTPTFCAKYGSEEELLAKTRQQLRDMGVDDGEEASVQK